MLKLPVPPLINSDAKETEQIKSLQSYLTNLVTTLQPLLDRIDAKKEEAPKGYVTSLSTKGDDLLVHTDNSTTVLQNLAKTNYAANVKTHTNSSVPKIVIVDKDNNNIDTQTIYPVVSKIEKTGERVDYTNVAGDNSKEENCFYSLSMVEANDGGANKNFAMKFNGQLGFKVICQKVTVPRNILTTDGLGRAVTVYKGSKSFNFYDGGFMRGRVPFVTATPIGTFPETTFSVTVNDVSNLGATLYTAGATNGDVDVFIIAIGK